MHECKRYGMSKNMEFVPVRVKLSKKDGKLTPDHCILSEEQSRLYFNQYVTGSNASLSRKKLCICRGLFKCIILHHYGIRFIYTH